MQKKGKGNIDEVKKQNKIESSKVCGLPNLGNICFLNSALQQIYMIEQITSQLKLLNDQKSQNILTQLGKLFNEMRKNGKDKKNIRECLKKIRKHLQKSLVSYQQGSQYDSFEVFLNILNELFERQSQIESLFELQYSIKCQCYTQTILRQLTIQNCTSKCSVCNDDLQRKIIKYPKYLIIRGAGNGKGLIQSIKQKQINYALQSHNIYEGDGQRGHYYTICRRNKDEVYLINDNKVQLITEESIQEFQEYCLFSIYEKVEQNKEQIKITQNQSKNTKSMRFSKQSNKKFKRTSYSKNEKYVPSRKSRQQCTSLEEERMEVKFIPLSKQNLNYQKQQKPLKLNNTSRFITTVIYIYTLVILIIKLMKQPSKVIQWITKYRTLKIESIV